MCSQDFGLTFHSCLRIKFVFAKRHNFVPKAPLNNVDAEVLHCSSSAVGDQATAGAASLNK